MAAPASRRDALAALAGFLAVPTIPAVAHPAAPSNVIAACDRAVAHMAWINDPSHPVEEWPDERTDAEMARFADMLSQVADQPSADLADIQAKARLILADGGSDLSCAGAPDHVRLLHRFLHEVIALGGVA